MPAGGSTRSSISSRYADVDNISYSHTRRLSIPRSNNRTSEWSTLFSEAVQLMLRDYSLAVALGLDPEGSLSSASRLTAPLLTSKEAEEYREWEGSSRIPKPDWKRLRSAPNATTPAQRARWEELTDALRVLYRDDALRPEHCKAWTERYREKMPLLIAAKKIEQTRYDIDRAGKGSSRAKRCVHEMVACRKLMAEVGRYKNDMGQDVRKMNKDIQEKEQDTMKRIERIERDAPTRREAAADLYKDRAKLYEKLAKLRVDRVETNITHTRQNAESTMLENILKGRMSGLDDRLRAERRRGRA